MATVTLLASLKTSDNETAIATVDFDASYPTGGEVITAAEVGLSNILGAIVSGPGTATFRAAWNQTAQALMLFIENGTSGVEAQAANTSDQSAVSVTCLFVGK